MEPRAPKGKKKRKKFDREKSEVSKGGRGVFRRKEALKTWNVRHPFRSHSPKCENEGLRARETQNPSDSFGFSIV